MKKQTKDQDKNCRFLIIEAEGWSMDKIEELVRVLHQLGIKGIISQKPIHMLTREEFTKAVKECLKS